ncbi:MAG TPA: addiction module toxin RelE [Candidatus Nanoarchaeia archaeon]|nr:addiction module toxin RelE [Candidatus Nanoarchaeia archaeon]
MYEHEIKPHLKEILQKLSKKNKALYEQVMKKIEEVISSSDIEHYKNLSYSMKELKRVHVGHFVLVFRFMKEENKLYFDDLDHHDKIYKRYR